MAYDQVPQSAAKSHSLELDKRERLSLSGVEDVMGFDESMVVLQTGLGRLSVRGEGLHNKVRPVRITAVHADGVTGEVL